MNEKRVKSALLQERASKVIPLGVNSNGRYWGKGETLYFDHAKGSHVWDVDGNEYIDYRLAFGPVILGYGYEPVDERVWQAIQRGVTPGITSEIEVRVAEKIIEMCPGMEMVRLVSTGTEATMHAIRVARAYTGREKIIKFEGGYHGSHDYVLFSTYAPPASYGNRRSPITIPASSGIPSSLNDLVITLPFNDREAMEVALSNCGHQVAAIISEPMLGNFGSAEPEPGFLEFIREQCDRYGILWVVDEVKTGFRIARGGAQEVYGIRPDLTTYAKSLGNGYPIAAYGGKREVMKIVGQGVTQGGTYAGNCVSAAAADATLDIFKNQPVHQQINRLGSRLQKGLAELFAGANIQALISRHPSIFTLSFGIKENLDARGWAKSDRDYYKKFAAGALNRGILLDEDPREPLCICYSHTDADIDKTLEIFASLVKEI